MLRRNMDPFNGLINGARGLLLDIEYENGHAVFLNIKFDDLDTPQKIARVSVHIIVADAN